MPVTDYNMRDGASPLQNEIFQSFQSLTALVRAMRLKKLTVLLLLLLVCSAILWVTIVSPFLAEGRSAWLALNPDFASEGSFNSHKSPKPPGLTLLKTLDPALLPRSSTDKAGADSTKKRLVFVGDIHGCKKELKALLKKAKFDPATDHLVAVGDVVSKGPDSLGVIDLLRKYDASCVRGNHDDQLLLAVHRLQSKNEKLSEDLNTLEDYDTSSEDKSVRKLAKSLSKGDLEYLQSCPAILRIGHLKAFGGEAAVVHAGLVPGVSLELQDPDSVMNMRIINLKTHLPSHQHKSKGSVPWYKLWNRSQQLQPLYDRLGKPDGGGRESRKHTTVIYGHNARDGLQIHKYTKGLDTGCVRGGKLTALVVDGDGRQEVFQVKATKNHAKQKHAT